MKTLLVMLMTACMTGCSHAIDAPDSLGPGPGYIEAASPALSQTIVKKGGSSVSFSVRASWGSSCGSFSRALVSLDGNVYTIKILGKQPKEAVCLTVMSSFTAPVTIELPSPGLYRYRFWQSDSTAIDTTFVTK